MATRPELHIAVAKTKNKASEYNDNFDMMMDYIDDTLDECKDYVDDFMPSVTNQSGKFLTNNGTTTSWGNLGNQPSGDYISGLKISKSSDDTIAITAGSCYDVARAVILTLGTDTTKQNSSQTASTTYYVYIIDGASTDILITTSSSNPTLPTGSTTYRQIGSYVTDADGNIKYIYGTAATIVETYHSGASWYCIYSDGRCEQGGVATGNGSSGKTVTLLKKYSSTSYSVVATIADYSSGNQKIVAIGSRTTSNFKAYTSSTTSWGSFDFSWQASGYMN